MELLRADPVPERTLQFADALCDRCRLLQRGNRIRLQLQRGIVGVERRPGFVVQQVGRREVEVGAHEAGVQPDGFLQVGDSVARSILLKANRAQNRIGGARAYQGRRARPAPVALPRRASPAGPGPPPFRARPAPRRYPEVDRSRGEGVPTITARVSVAPPSPWPPVQNSNLNPSCADREVLHWLLTVPKAGELKFWFGSQKTTRSKMLPIWASNRNSF